MISYESTFLGNYILLHSCLKFYYGFRQEVFNFYFAAGRILLWIMALKTETGWKEHANDIRFWVCMKYIYFFPFQNLLKLSNTTAFGGLRLVSLGIGLKNDVVPVVLLFMPTSPMSLFLGIELLLVSFFLQKFTHVWSLCFKATLTYLTPFVFN